MTSRMSKRLSFHPSVREAMLEERLVLSTSATGSTPLAAPPPVYSPVVISSVAHWKTVRQLRVAYAHEVQLATLDLRNGAAHEIQKLYANGSVPTSQQLSDLNASIQGVLDATALRLSSQASLLPGSGTHLVSSIQDALLGSGSKSLSSELSSLIHSRRDTSSVVKLQSAFARQIINAPSELDQQFNRFFTTTNMSELSVNSSGQQIPLKQFMAAQVVTQFGNTLGSLAQSFGSVANSMLYPTGSTGNPTQALADEFSQAGSNALSTAAYELGGSLSLFDGNANIISQIDPMIFGSSTSTNSLAGALAALPFGATDLNSAVVSAFNTSFADILDPLTSALGMQVPTTLTLPTVGFTSPFSSEYSGGTFDSGFNNGFASPGNSGFVGFGAAPTAFNTNFATGFSSTVSSATQNQGFATYQFPPLVTGAGGVLISFN